MKHILLALLSCASLPAAAQTFTYNFSTGYDGWAGDFADYPITDSVFYQLEFARTTLPAPLNTGQHALMIKGSNHSDDLFMFLKRKITGLAPNITYRLRIDITLASNAPTNAAGVGGAPGEGVTLKAGATLIEPKKVPNLNGRYRMNIDKANQTMPGADMDTIGHIGVADNTTNYMLINRSNASHQFTITTDATGEVWVCIGTDSGFESLTRLYYTQISLAFTSVSNVVALDSQTFNVYPNPATDVLHISLGALEDHVPFSIVDGAGRVVREVVVSGKSGRISVQGLPSGTYFLRTSRAPEYSHPFVKR